MKIAILGYAKQGASTLEYWNNGQNEITICDRNENLEIPDGFSAQLGQGYLKGLDKFDLLVRTPALHPREIVSNNSPEILSKVTSNTNEFFKVCPTKNIIGITGTKGKGTTSTLISEMLKEAGKTVHLGGNIGTPPLELIKNGINPDDWVVLELANFQLIDLKYSPHIAVCVMMAPEHLDWHESPEEYYDSKKQIFSFQKNDDFAIYFAQNDISKKLAFESPGHKIGYFSEEGAFIRNGNVVIDGIEICDTKDVKLLGEHNLQNVCAAVTAFWQINQSTDIIRKVITSFSGLPYRLEKIAVKRGVAYYNDSFGTTPETAMVAYQSIKEPKIGIVGGSDKGANFEDLAKVIANSNTKALIEIGKTGPKIAELVNTINPSIKIVSGLSTMKDIVNTASQMSIPGDVVLLSCGDASFGLFKNYQDRGDQFNQAVSELPSGD